MSILRLLGPAQPKEVIERHAKEIEERGYTVIPDVLNPKQVVRVREALDEVFASEDDIAIERHWKTKQYRVAYMLTAKNDVFRRLPSNPKVLDIMKRVLGRGVNLASTNGLTMTPGGLTQELHRDQSMSIPGTVITINALHCLDDFTKANGGTRLVPFSHLKVTRGRLELDDDHEKEAIYMEAPAGSVIAYAGSVLHAGSKNTTALPRRAVHLFYTRSWYKPQWDFPHSLPRKIINSLSNAEKHLFGFGSQPQIWDAKTRRLTGTSRPKKPLWTKAEKKKL